MKNVVRCLAVALLSFFVTTEAHALFVEGEKLNSWIQAQKRIEAHTSTEADFQGAAELLGYVQGIYDEMEMSLPTESDLSKCQLRTPGQLVAVVTLYVSEHPEELSKPADLLVDRAILGACRKNKN